MKVLTYVASSMLLGRAVAENEKLHFTKTILGLHLHNYEQKGNAIKCKDDAEIDAELRETGGRMDFDSDSVEMCARVCDCRQGCVSFTWVKPDGFNGEPEYVLAPGTNNVGDQGKCSLYTSDCTESNQEEASAATYAFAKVGRPENNNDASPTDVRAKYPVLTSDANEREVTDQVACVLDGVLPLDGYVMVGGGGAFPGVCVSGGGTAKLTDLDLATGGTLEKCREICDSNDDCKMFNIGTGKCKFRTQRCQTSWVTGKVDNTAFTTYIKGAVTMPPTSPPTNAPIAPTGPPPATPIDGGDQEFSSAASTRATALAAALALALVY